MLGTLKSLFWRCLGVHIPPQKVFKGWLHFLFCKSSLPELGVISEWWRSKSPSCRLFGEMVLDGVLLYRIFTQQLSKLFPKWLAATRPRGSRKDVQSSVHPRKLTWNLKMMVFQRDLLFQGFIFRFHVSFGGCRFSCIHHQQLFFFKMGIRFEGEKPR